MDAPSLPRALHRVIHAERKLFRGGAEKLREEEAIRIVGPAASAPMSFAVDLAKQQSARLAQEATVRMLHACAGNEASPRDPAGSTCGVFCGVREAGQAKYEGTTNT